MDRGQPEPDIARGLELRVEERRLCVEIGNGLVVKEEDGLAPVLAVSAQGNSVSRYHGLNLHHAVVIRAAFVTWE